MSVKKLLGLETFPIKEAEIMARIADARRKNLKEVIFTGDQRKVKIKKTGLQLADIIKTHGDNKKIKNFTNYKKFTKIDGGIKNLINWFIDYYKI